MNAPDKFSPPDDKVIWLLMNVVYKVTLGSAHDVHLAVMQVYILLARSHPQVNLSNHNPFINYLLIISHKYMSWQLINNSTPTVMHYI